jgi:fructose-1,6-bisphosphatase/inositol monophosphatase family enzyme
MTPSSLADALQRIHNAVEAACTALNGFAPGAITAEYKLRHNPVTEADRLVDYVLRQELLREGEGWLSEESVDDFSRLTKPGSGSLIHSHRALSFGCCKISR